MRGQDAAALVEETVGFHVKAKDKDEAQMRQQLAEMKLDEVRRSRGMAITRGRKATPPGKGGANVGALQQPGHKPHTTEKFERRVTNMVDGPPNGSKVQEKYQQEWTNELQKGGPGRGAEAGGKGDEEAERRGRTPPQSPGLGPGPREADPQLVFCWCLGHQFE